MPRVLLSLAALALLIACSGSRERAPGTPGVRSDAGTSSSADSGISLDAGFPDAGDLDAGEADAGMPITLPDPAGGPPMGAILFGGGGWDGEPFDNQTPMTAVPMGTVTDPGGPLYIQDTTSAYFVFTAGADLNEIAVQLFVPMGVIEFIHLHDATGLVLGDEITPTTYEETGGAFSAAWTTTPGQVYLLEIKLFSDQFF